LYRIYFVLCVFIIVILRINKESYQDISQLFVIASSAESDIDDHVIIAVLADRILNVGWEPNALYRRACSTQTIFLL
jgi:hypothetical protein